MIVIKGEFAHNDLKWNNGVLNVKTSFYLVTFDFGKSDVFGKAKNAVPKPSHIK